jgi:hypothetical protein
MVKDMKIKVPKYSICQARPNPNEDFDIRNALNPVKITSGKFRGLVYRYGAVEPMEDGTLAFEYTIIDNPRKVKDNSKLHSVLGDILIHIMLQIQEFESISKKNKSNG